MKKFEVLEHKADLKIRIFGATKEELFRHCLEAMAQSQNAKIKNQKSASRKIKITSLDLSTLLVDFLSEVLYQSQINKEVYSKVEFKEFSDPSMGSGQVAKIEAEISGQKIERFGEDIKAVTYHDLEVSQKENGSWEATVLFDI